MLIPENFRQTIGIDLPGNEDSPSFEDAAEPGRLYESKRLDELTPHGIDNGGELLKHRFLCRGGGLLIAAPTGIGKSVLAMQMQLCFAIGRPCLGLVPARPLTALYVQAENDEGDLIELRDGILDGLQFTKAEREQAFSNIRIATIDDSCGMPFLTGPVPQLLEGKPTDTFYCDPLLSYLGGNVSQQEVVSPWLRNGLNPLLHRHQCAGIMFHHTNKPPSGREKPDWQAGDFAYIGSGSAELANWPRAIIAIRATGSHDVFELRLGKRGARVGWQQPDGTRSYSRHIAHAQDGIYWREAEAHEIPTIGRHPASTVKDVVGLLKGEMTTAEWRDVAREELGISESTFYRLRREAESSGKAVRSKLSGKWISKP